MEMLLEVGYCPGIENYSRPLSRPPAGRDARRRCSISFPTITCCSSTSRTSRCRRSAACSPATTAARRRSSSTASGCPARSTTGRCKFDEWEQKINQVVFVSATPGPYELEQTGGEVVEQVIRPTGLLDPVIEVSPARGQVPHLLEQIRERAAAGERVLVTTLTKRLAEDLSLYLTEQGIRCKWLHSELDAFERVELLRELREGQFDALVGVNLLREGLDLPEVSLVAILDADKEGFLRSETSLIQTIGRAARNVNAKVILYADRVTDSMQRAIDETERRRALQEEYNREHGITPETIRKGIRAGIEAEADGPCRRPTPRSAAPTRPQYITEEYLTELEAEMLAAAEALEFERAAGLRDRIERMRASLGSKVAEVDAKRAASNPRRRGRGGRLPRPKR